MLPVGQVAMNPGAENASVDHFTIRIQGRSAHVSTPELGADALYAAAQIVTALQSIVGRLKNPTDPALLSQKVLLQPFQCPGRPQKGGGMGIVAAGVHHSGALRCVGDGFLVLNGQGVYVRPEMRPPRSSLPSKALWGD